MRVTWLWRGILARSMGRGFCGARSRVSHEVRVSDSASSVCVKAARGAAFGVRFPTVTKPAVRSRGGQRRAESPRPVLQSIFVSRIAASVCKPDGRVAVEMGQGSCQENECVCLYSFRTQCQWETGACNRMCFQSSAARPQAADRIRCKCTHGLSRESRFEFPITEAAPSGAVLGLGFCVVSERKSRTGVRLFRVWFIEYGRRR